MEEGPIWNQSMLSMVAVNDTTSATRVYQMDRVLNSGKWGLTLLGTTSHLMKIDKFNAVSRFEIERGKK